MLLVIILLLIYLSLLAGLLAGLLLPGKPALNSRQPFVSIIVAARNEAAALPHCIKALTQQDYPHEKMEIILVDDRSTDNTWTIIQDYARRYPFIHTLQITGAPEWQSGKKSALQQAYTLAQGEFLFFTDADCRPPSTWISEILPLFTDDIGLVAGFSPQQAKTSPAWNGFLFMESLAAALVAAASIGLGRGVTCAGRNLAARASTLRDIAGYTRLPDTLSGDDDFLLQAVARQPRWQCRYSFSPRTHVPAAGPSNLRQYFRQKSRHLSAGKRFSWLQQTGYALYYAANYGLWLAAIAALWINAALVIPLVLKLAADWFVLTLFSKKLHSPFKLQNFLLWQALFPALHLAAAPRAFFSKLTWHDHKGTRHV
ncbi:MAG TPA: glycosyltransferase [bacterium]|nr:glycosyltransferase [bacterium]